MRWYMQVMTVLTNFKRGVSLSLLPQNLLPSTHACTRFACVPQSSPLLLSLLRLDHLGVASTLCQHLLQVSGHASCSSAAHLLSLGFFVIFWFDDSVGS